MRFNNAAITDVRFEPDEETKVEIEKFWGKKIITVFITIEAKMDLIVAMTACSAEMSNNYSFKPIGYAFK